MKNSRPEQVVSKTALPDRRALDAVVFDALGLMQGEREAVVALVRKRLEKAGSV